MVHPYGFGDVQCDNKYEPSSVDVRNSFVKGKLLNAGDTISCDVNGLTFGLVRNTGNTDATVVVKNTKLGSPSRKLKVSYMVISGGLWNDDIVINTADDWDISQTAGTGGVIDKDVGYDNNSSYWINVMDYDTLDTYRVIVTGISSTQTSNVCDLGSITATLMTG